jgi:hypothetical protein
VNRPYDISDCQSARPYRRCGQQQQQSSAALIGEHTVSFSAKSVIRRTRRRDPGADFRDDEGWCSDVDRHARQDGVTSRRSQFYFPRAASPRLFLGRMFSRLCGSTIRTAAHSVPHQKETDTFGRRKRRLSFWRAHRRPPMCLSWRRGRVAPGAEWRARVGGEAGSESRRCVGSTGRKAVPTASLPNALAHQDIRRACCAVEAIMRAGDILDQLPAPRCTLYRG